MALVLEPAEGSLAVRTAVPCAGGIRYQCQTSWKAQKRGYAIPFTNESWPPCEVGTAILVEPYSSECQQWLFCYVYETFEKDMTRSDYACGMAEKVEKHLQFVCRHITFSTPLSWCHLQTGDFVIRQLQLLFYWVNLYFQEGELCWWANCFFSGAVGKPSLAGLVCGQGGWCLVCCGDALGPQKENCPDSEHS